MRGRSHWFIARTTLLVALTLLVQGCKKAEEQVPQPAPQQQAQQPPAQPPAQTPPAQTPPAPTPVAAENKPAPAAKTTKKTAPVTPPPAVASQPAAAATNGDVDPSKAFGSRNAAVTMEVFSDFQCPACKTLFTTTNRRLMDDYVSNGKVYMIHRDFPLPMHAHSREAARYARAAAQLGKVEIVEQALFQNQEKWEQTGDVDGTVAAVLSPAEMSKVRALVKSGTLEPLIEKDYALGQSYGVNQTPYTVFHSRGQTYPFAGIMTYDTLKTFLEQLLSQE